MNHSCKRLICLALCLLFCLGCLPACTKKASASVKNGITSVTAIKKERLSIQINLNQTILDAHKGEKLYLYELLPGEELTDLSGKSPLKEKKISGSITLEIPLVEKGVDRRYSSFVTTLSDGTVLENEAKWIQNPTFLATNRRTSLWAGSPKGLVIDDPEVAWSLGALQGLVELPLSSLLDGSDVYEFGGMEYTYSESFLTDLDGRLSAARATGMQLTLELIPDLLPSYDTAAAMLDLLCARYAGEADQVFVLMLNASDLTPKTAATLAQYAQIALRSRTANGRISVEYDGASEKAAEDFFLELHDSIATLGAFEWDACIVPVCQGTSEGGALTPDRLSDFFRFLRGNQLRNSPTLLTVNHLRFARGDGSKQLANLALAYRLAISAGASTVFYGEQNDDLYGLYDSEGKTPLALAELYKELDAELSAEYVGLFNSLTDGAFEKVSYSPSHKRLTGTTALGSDGKEYELLYDFSNNDTHGFDAIGGIGADPACVNSASLSRPVLFAWLESGSAPEGEGIRQVLPNGQALQSVFSLSARMLLQNEAAASSEVTLRLEGVSRTGAHISYEASATVENGRWQTVIFYIASFVSEADLSSPCVLTLTAESEAPEGTQYPMWVDNLSVRRPETQNNTLHYTLLILGCAVLGLGLPLALYHVIRLRRLRRARRRR